MRRTAAAAPPAPRTGRARRPSPPDIAAALRQVLDLCAVPPPPRRARRLDTLFRELAQDVPPRGAEETGDLIWALWTSHDDSIAAQAMQTAIDQIVAKKAGAARATLDSLCENYPDWAEAFNKRATLAFIEARDADAVADIVETLAREPRHFGALAGFGQIALRQGHPAAALAAYETALALNPHLGELAAAAAELRGLYAARPN